MVGIQDLRPNPKTLPCVPSRSLSLSYLFIILSGRVLFLELKRIHTYTRRHGVGPDNFVLEKKEEPPQHGFLS